MTTYEYRTHDNPQAMPYGTGTISRHRTAGAAFDAWQAELDALKREPGNQDSYLSRIVVAVEDDGTVRLISLAELDAPE